MYRTFLTVRGNELDSYNHVNNAVYLNYYEHARWEAFRQAGVLERLQKEDLMCVVTDIQIRYMREATLLDELEVQTTFSKTSPFLVFGQRIINRKTGLALSRAKTKTVFLNAAREPQDIPSFIHPLLS